MCSSSALWQSARGGVAELGYERVVDSRLVRLNASRPWHEVRSATRRYVTAGAAPVAMCRSGTVGDFEVRHSGFCDLLKEQGASVMGSREAGVPGPTGVTLPKVLSGPVLHRPGLATRASLDSAGYFWRATAK